MNVAQNEKAARFRALHEGPGAFVLAAEIGLVGCTIEDTTGKQDRPLYDLPLAVERIAAAAEAARALRFAFSLTARAHNFIYPDPSLDDTITRLQAFRKGWS